MKDRHTLLHEVFHLVDAVFYNAPSIDSQGNLVEAQMKYDSFGEHYSTHVSKVILVLLQFTPLKLLVSIR
jgi:hypothetical protein